MAAQNSAKRIIYEAEPSIRRGSAANKFKRKIRGLGRAAILDPHVADKRASPKWEGRRGPNLRT